MKNLHKINENIYITSDEEIKKDEYYLGEDNNIYCLVTTVNFNGKKIILTTDQSLDGIQAIDDEFLEWFVKNPSCEEVEIRCYSKFNDGDFTDYKIIIPKEEPITLGKIIPKERVIGLKEPKQRLKKYSERFDNDKSPIGNPETWGKRILMQEPNIIDQWLEKNGTSEISKQVEEEAEELCKQETDYTALLQQVGTKYEFDNDILSCLNEKCICKHNKIMRQETLEENSKSHAIYELENNYKPTKETFKLACKRSFIRGAKWQQEQDYAMIQGYLSANLKNMELLKRSYSEEDMQQAIQFGKDIRSEKSFINHNFGSPYIDYEDSTLETAEWFKQLKKK